MRQILSQVLPQALRRISLYLLWIYTLLLLAGWGIHLLVGDTLWWLALATSFMPLFFLPLLLGIPLGFWVRRPAYWIGLLPPVVLFLYLYGLLFLPSLPPPYQTDAPTLRLMTFNLWGGSHRARTAQVIIEQGLPDIVVLQELTSVMQKLILTAVGPHYPYYFFDTVPGSRGLGILSRYPLERMPPPDLLIDLSCRQYRVRMDDLQQFRLYNCHPRSTNFLYFSGDLRVLAKQVEETFRLRTLLSQHIVQDLQRHREPALVVGDFNTTDQSDAYRNFRAVLADAHRAVGWGFGHTFPSGSGFFRQMPIIERQVRIDMIFYTADFVALHSAVGAAHGESDHLPLTATLGWRRMPQ